MTLSPGTRLGEYEIREAIGSGGMGEVYRARDTRLGRDVAIKILPGAAAADQERRARFEREAKAVATLNHPNIVTIHAVEDAAGVPFFTMEYVDGRTLSQLIPPRGLPLDELLRIAIPLTDAVGAAHQRGVLHRDLKPANVMVTAEGRVKVLDFGLAKLKETVMPADAGSAPTVEATGEGRILGTVAYMSPEQAEGKPLDQRSDVFSLGILLYEMVTGQRPFKGDTSVSVISAILKDTPGSVTDLRPDLPRDLAKIVKRALQKDPEHRYQTAKDLRNDLETLKEDLDSGEVLRSSALPPAIAGVRRRRWIPGAAVVAVLVLLAAGAWWAALRLRPAPQASRAARLFDEFTLTPLTTEETTGRAAAVSPDGRYVAYAFVEQGREGLRVRQTERSATVQVVPPEDVQVYDLTFAPDGNRLLYVAYPRGSGRATLYEVPVLGGAPRRLIEDVDRAATFSPDGARIAFVRGFPGKGSAIVVANADGTGERTLAARDNPNQFVLANLAWSPDGRVIAAAAYDAQGMIAIVTVNTATGEVQRVGSPRWVTVSSLAWHPGGRALFVAAMDFRVANTPQLWEVSMPEGAVRRITKDIAGYTRVALTADGRTAVTVRSEYRGTIWVAPSAQPDRLAQISSVPNTVGGLALRWTTDGRIVYTASVAGNFDIWAVRPDGNARRQLTTSPAMDGYATVAPDDQHIVFLSNRTGAICLWRMDPDGSRQTQLTKGPLDGFPVVAGDGRSVYFVRRDLPREPLCVVPMKGGEPAIFSAPALAASAGDTGLPGFWPHSLSPDGTMLAGMFFDEQQNRTRIAIVPVLGQGAVRKLDVPVPLGTSQSLAWATDGRALTFSRTTDGASNLWRQPIEGGPATRLTNYTSADTIVAHAWSRDGKLLALVRGTTESQLVMLRDVAGSRNQ